MARQCKICTSELRSQIDQLIINGASSRWISEWCNDKGFQVSEATIRKHAREHIENYEFKTFEVKSVEPNESMNYIDSNNIGFDWQMELEKLGLKENELSDIDKNLSTYQKGITLLTFKTLTLINHHVDESVKGLVKFPIEKIKSFKILSELYFKSLGIEKRVDLNAAIETLTNQGYKIIEDD